MIWKWSRSPRFDTETTECEIPLTLHPQRFEMEIGTCMDGKIVGFGDAINNYHGEFTSKLRIRMDHEFNGTYIQCAVENVEQREEIVLDQIELVSTGNVRDSRFSDVIVQLFTYSVFVP